MYSRIIDWVVDTNWKEEIKKRGWIKVIMTFLALIGLMALISFFASEFWAIVFVPMGLPAIGVGDMTALQAFLYLIWPRVNGGKD